MDKSFTSTLNNTDYKIRFASADDATRIKELISNSFSIYQAEIDKSNAPHKTIHALTETENDIISDINNATVLVAINSENDIVGTIRFKKLSNELAYVYRFGVDPHIKNIGLGSNILGHVLDLCKEQGFKAVSLHTNSCFYNLARYYYGKRFFVHSTTFDKGYIRALFVKELYDNVSYDISPAFCE